MSAGRPAGEERAPAGDAHGGDPVEYTKKLAEFCAAVKFEDLPEDVVSRAKLCVLDCIANIYGSLELEAVGRVVESYRIESFPGGQATALGCGFKTGIRDAAFVNGMTAEAIEGQDGVRFGGNHPCSAVIPAAFAVAESRGCSGRALIEAVVAGYEAANRTAASVHPFHTLSGFLPTGTCGTFGAAAAASRLIGGGPGGMLDALGNAGYLLPLSMAEDLMGGYTVKIAQGGQAASAGITAAVLASAGITGHPQALEGSELGGGFTQITLRFGAEAILDRIVDGLGERFTISDVYFKPYTACRHTHGAAQAALEIRSEYGIAADDVESVRVNTYAIANVAVGKGVSGGGSFVEAQFSIPYVVAACLLDGDMGPAQLTEGRMADRAILELADRVTVEQDEGLNALYPGMTASRVEIVLKNGRVLTKQVDIPTGDPRDPMDSGRIADKVRRFAAGRDGDAMDDVITAVMTLEELDGVSMLAALI